jgi:hypothetical protein
MRGPNKAIPAAAPETTTVPIIEMVFYVKVEAQYMAALPDSRQ